MDPQLVSRFLILYNWFLTAALLIFLMLIARMFERFSGFRTYFRWFLLPVIFFGAAAVRYSSIKQIAADLSADALMAAGGIALLWLCVRLFQRMIQKLEQ